jgi:hypothetical protein
MPAAGDRRGKRVTRDAGGAVVVQGPAGALFTPCTAVGLQPPG